MRKISTNDLIAEDFVSFTRKQINYDGFIDLYLHTSGGLVEVGGGEFGSQTITSLPISSSDRQFFEDIVFALDELLDLDFRFTSDLNSSDIRFYYDQEINLDGGQTLGLASSNSESGQNWWELFLNTPAFENDQNHLRYGLIHEFGHSLGLEHPFDDSDGDAVDGITDPWRSVYPEDTVMAYRSPIGRRWPNAYTVNDLEALVSIWGAETQVFSDQSEQIIGGNYSEFIISAGGDDLIRGLRGHDTLNGGQGNDQILGGPGADQLFAGLGNDLLRAGFGHDQLIGGGGDDQLWGGFGSDVFVISSGQDVVFDFRVSDGDRLGIRSGLDYSLSQQGNDMVVQTALGMTTLLGMNVAVFDPTSMSIAV